MFPVKKSGFNFKITFLGILSLIFRVNANPALFCVTVIYFEFACNKHGSTAEQLQLLLLYLASIQIQIEQFNAQVQDLVAELELLLHLDHPVDEQQAHLSVYVRLTLDIVLDNKLILALSIILEYKRNVVVGVELVQFAGVASRPAPPLRGVGGGIIGVRIAATTAALLIACGGGVAGGAGSRQGP